MITRIIIVNVFNRQVVCNKYLNYLYNNSTEHTRTTEGNQEVSYVTLYQT